MNLSPDSRAALLLSSRMGLSGDDDLEPLSRREWNALERRLSTSGGISRLEGLSSEEITARLELDVAGGERLAALLGRGEELEGEIQRLDSLGIWILTRLDENYPERYRVRFREKAPIVLFGAGKQDLLGRRGLAVAGSRHVDDAGRSCAQFIGSGCAESGLVVYSGAARGVDATTMGAALESGGRAVGVLADSLERTLRSAEIRDQIDRGTLALITPYSTKAQFTVGIAMGRNKLIYGLADWGIVVASDAEKGGTWAGAVETLKTGRVPLFIRAGEDVPEGNRLLIKAGGVPFPFPFPQSASGLGDWLEANARDGNISSEQATLF